jgi:hypothetical protein
MGLTGNSSLSWVSRLMEEWEPTEAMVGIQALVLIIFNGAEELSNQVTVDMVMVSNLVMVGLDMANNQATGVSHIKLTVCTQCTADKI